MLRDSQNIVIALVTGAVMLTTSRLSFAQNTETSAAPAGPPKQESVTHRGTRLNRTDETPKNNPVDGAEQPEPSEEKKKRKFENPSLPEGMTLDEVLDRAEKTPPKGFPDAISDDNLHFFLIGERLEYRFDPGDGPDHVGLEMQSWFGGDYNRLWMKFEGEGFWQGVDGFEGEIETDLLYSRLISQFWNVQFGAQYANEWTSDDYEDLWSVALSLQGMAPGMFEVDLSMYLSEEVNVTFVLEAEYDIRITQRLVLQPRTELSFSAQDIPKRNIAAGITDAVVDVRLWYEIKREFAPYVGVRFQTLVGKTADRAEKTGHDPSRLSLIAGIRFAVY